MNGGFSFTFEITAQSPLTEYRETVLIRLGQIGLSQMVKAFGVSSL